MAVDDSGLIMADKIMHYFERGRPWNRPQYAMSPAHATSTFAWCLCSPRRLPCDARRMVRSHKTGNAELPPGETSLLALPRKPPLPARAQVSGSVVGTFQQPPPNILQNTEGLRTPVSLDEFGKAIAALLALYNPKSVMLVIVI